MDFTEDELDLDDLGLDLEAVDPPRPPDRSRAAATYRKNNQAGNQADNDASQRWKQPTNTIKRLSKGSKRAQRAVRESKCQHKSASSQSALHGLSALPMLPCQNPGQASIMITSPTL